METYNFKEELRDQLEELKQTYGEQIADHQWQEENYYDGEYCNPPSYRSYQWVCHFVNWRGQLDFFSQLPRCANRQTVHYFSNGGHFRVL